MTKYLESILMIAEHPVLSNHFLPYIDVTKEEVDWERLPYSALSGSQQVAISWAYSLWTDDPPSTRGYRHLFDGFGGLDHDLQLTILRAVIHRYGVNKGPSSGEVLAHLLGSEGKLNLVK